MSVPASPDSADDLARLKKEYEDRAGRPELRARYSPFNPAHLFMLQSRQRETLALLRKLGIVTLAGKRILEVGCGFGDVLYEYLGFGAEPSLLHGLDYLPDRLSKAQARVGHLPLVQADGQRLPYSPDIFDIVIQYTVFSSILDSDTKGNIAREMVRVVRKSNGIILWFDFWTNPSNPQTHGIRRPEIRKLFPDCQFVFRRITLAPPIARHLARISWNAGGILESVRILNTHYLVAIAPIDKGLADSPPQ